MSVMGRARRPLYESLLVSLGLYATLSAVVTPLNFPYDTDPAADVSAQTGLKQYYDGAYKAPRKSEPAPAATAGTLSAEQDKYVELGRYVSLGLGIPEEIRRFVETRRLKDKRVLEIGAGSGLLQDIVDDYTALDISPAARRFFHKPFVEASATAMPFADNTFDAAWSIYTLEHIPNPEKALSEMRRVVKNNGYILLRPAWNCTPWAAEGYEVRPFSDFGWKGKSTKASLWIRGHGLYRLLYGPQIRAIRAVSTRLSGKPSRMRFTRLTPNYAQYWMPDSDAVVSLDYHEAYLWFKTRGDVCLNCPNEALLVTETVLQPQTIAVQVRKRS